eukprot:6070872-Pyramimonas_sp.AAC.1
MSTGKITPGPASSPTWPERAALSTPIRLHAVRLSHNLHVAYRGAYDGGGGRQRLRVRFLAAEGFPG